MTQPPRRVEYSHPATHREDTVDIYTTCRQQWVVTISTQPVEKLTVTISTQPADSRQRQYLHKVLPLFSLPNQSQGVASLTSGRQWSCRTECECAMCPQSSCRQPAAASSSQTAITQLEVGKLADKSGAGQPPAWRGSNEELNQVLFK